MTASPIRWEYFGVETAANTKEGLVVASIGLNFAISSDFDHHTEDYLRSVF